MTKPLVNGLRGFCMGAADVVPGVSGGTVALLLGIYPTLMTALRNFDSILLREVLALRIAAAAKRANLELLVPLGIGIVCAVLFFTRVVPLPQLIQTHPEHVYGLFFGLIVASVIVLLRDLSRHGTTDPGARPFGPLALLCMAAGIAFGLAVVTMVPRETPDASWFIFLCGAVAISAMLLPGVSGSFVLLMLNKYAYVFDAIGHFKLAIVVPFAAGLVVGVMAFSRVLNWLITHYYTRTLAFVTGVLVASLYVIWPFQDRVFETVREKARLVSSTPRLPAADDQMLGAFAMLMIGLGLVAVIDSAARQAGRQPGSRRTRRS